MSWALGWLLNTALTVLLGPETDEETYDVSVTTGKRLR